MLLSLFVFACSEAETPEKEITVNVMEEFERQLTGRFTSEEQANTDMIMDRLTEREFPVDKIVETEHP